MVIEMWIALESRRGNRVDLMWGGSFSHGSLPYGGRLPCLGMQSSGSVGLGAATISPDTTGFGSVE